MNEVFNMKSSQYDEYFTSRMPSRFAIKYIYFWHKRMFNIGKKSISNFLKKKICEIGPGHGFFAEICTINKMSYSGYEINIGQAEKLMEMGYNVEAATCPPMPQGDPVDIIWISHVLEHMSSFQKARELMISCNNRLSKNGYIVIIGPDLLHWKFSFWDRDWTHGYPTSKCNVEQLLNDTGFIVHKSMHHAFTVTNPLFAWAISRFFRLFPGGLIDYFNLKIFKKTFFASFMNLFGLRQIYIIGQKRNETI